MRSPRVALFTDSYFEANGVARTAKALESYAARRGFPLLCVMGGSRTTLSSTSEGTRLELKRGRWAFRLEHDLQFDLFLWRHGRMVAQALKDFRPDVLHFTGPSDVGQLGAYLGHRLHIPMVGSWHTNLHEYASRRWLKGLTWLPESRRLGLRHFVERHALSVAVQFYRIPRVVLAPNGELADLLSQRTGKPVYVMSRGVDTDLFTPARRTRPAGPVNLGFVGRLSPEKSVRLLAAVERALVEQGSTEFQFTIVGEGSERAWLERHMTRAVFRGVLRGDRLAEAYANMDLFVFPSETETVGNVVLEAMASGVPVVAMARGGPRFTVDDASGVLAETSGDFIAQTAALVRDRDRRLEMADAARRRALQLSWDRIFDEVYRAYAIVSSREVWRVAATASPASEPVVERQRSA